MKLLYLPVNDFCPEACNYCENIGQLKKISKKEFLDYLKSAKFWEYDGIVLPCNNLFQKNYLSTIQKILDYDLIPYIQVNAISLHKGWKPIFEQLHHLNCKFQVIIADNLREEAFLFLEFIENNKFDFDILIIPNLKLDVIELLEQLLNFKKQIYFSFPFKLNDNDNFLYTSEIYDLLIKIESFFPKTKVRTPPGQEAYFPKMPKDYQKDPVLEPEIINFKKNTKSIDISIIIPTYNNCNYLINTVRHLSLQSLDKGKYEIIVVDDGSTDGTHYLLRLWANANANANWINLKYIYFPRKKPRVMGDNQFRAGVARNLGAKMATGRIFTFLDSDILVPPNFLQTLLKEHEQHPIIQTQRLFLKKEMSHKETNYLDIVKERDTYLPEGDYWLKFYQQGKEWNHLSAPWKYICTYSLSLPQKIFKELGWFRKNYIFYGFEDTDLGLRLYKNGYPFYLSDMIVFHLDHSTNRSEYSNSDYKRQILLKNTAKIFFHNNLDMKIYEELNSLVKEDFQVKRFLKKYLLTSIGRWIP